MKNSILLLVVIGVAGSMLSCIVTSIATFYGNEQEMAAYDEIYFLSDVQDARDNDTSSKNKSNQLTRDLSNQSQHYYYVGDVVIPPLRNPSEQAQHYYYAGDVFIPPPETIFSRDSIEKVVVSINYHWRFYFGRLIMYSYRAQQIIIRNARIVYDSTGLEVPLQIPGENDVINVELKPPMLEQAGAEYFWKYGMDLEWAASENDMMCDNEVCIDITRNDLSMRRGNTYRLMFEVEFEEDGISKTKNFEYKYIFDRITKKNVFELLVEGILSM